ncbi:MULTISPECIES: ABC transporter substrate-binding protein [Streptomyces]|uniref:ABC transporter substrate-binding protein n=1 Tax=Streptomyces tendae TaxID=1932 RepID=A0ABW7S3D9_STRTE|nr:MULTISPECIES: ABC transporter substrate-binding protein [unclassified Streptomyces]BET52312.1 amonabactin ABC transporter substrate-binding protein [Kitasatospora aureofaciens]MBQ0963373.1 ABC transporter substrate-binding protein [Streptomyces sp. RK74B]MBQ1002736.1 ABC transporter substrate-binding protein [Streptomyces sp. RK23]MCW1099486.1 ABC transporter substrate-binding protein [Streptomyces sp. RS2]MZG20198.1 ABC transporter substrate-binding protein [Streptomyces sp. SID5914]
MSSVRASRRTVVTSAAAVVAGALLLTGCGEDDGGSDSAGGQASSTRRVTDATGRQVEVPAAPKKVVTLSEPTLDAALALGVEPVGATAGRGQQGVSTYLAAKAGKADVVATVAEADMEKLAALQPDLILLDETTAVKKEVSKLESIAPTVVTAKLNEDWKKAFTATADALNQKAAAEKLLSDFDADVAAAKGKLGENAGAVVSVVRWQNKAPSAVGRGVGHVGATLTALGLDRPKDQQGAGTGHSEPVSLEKLSTIDGDWLFLGTLGEKTDGEKAYAEARKVPNFGKLKAEREGHVVVVQGSAWNSAGGPLAARVVLDDLTAALTS